MRNYYLLISLIVLAMPLSGQIFTEIEDQPFPAVTNAAADYADIDNDGDLDLFIAGEGVAELYLNDGTGQFSLDTTQSFQNMGGSLMEFADLNGDDHPDFIHLGTTGSGMYLNDGSGQFSLTGQFDDLAYTYVSTQPFFDLEDIDNDGDIDVSVSINAIAYGLIRRIYLNDGNGVFSIATNYSFPGNPHSLELIYFNDDTFPDLMRRNQLDFGGSTNQPDSIFLNDGSGNFTFLSLIEAANTVEGTFDLFDMDRDCDFDLLSTGVDSTNLESSYLHRRESISGFINLPIAPFRELFLSASAIGDVDLDGDMDVVLGGLQVFGTFGDLYLNDGVGNFSIDTLTPIVAVETGSIKLFDIDGDRDLDLLVAGTNIFAPSQLTTLYRNNTIASTPVGNECSDAIDLNFLFGNEVNVSAVSSSYDNYLATNTESDPDFGYACFAETDGNQLYRTLWYSFTGDGFSYRIRTRACNPFSCRNEADTQIALYSGVDCADLSAEICNDNASAATQGEQYAEIEIVTEVGREYRLMVDAGGRGHGEFCLEVTRTGNVAVVDISNTAIEVYPNPTNGQINISGLQADRVTVFDHVGRRLMDVEQGGNVLDLARLPTGLYLLKIFAGEEVYSAKVIRE